MELFGDCKSCWVTVQVCSVTASPIPLTHDHMQILIQSCLNVQPRRVLGSLVLVRQGSYIFVLVIIRPSLQKHSLCMYHQGIDK